MVVVTFAVLEEGGRQRRRRISFSDTGVESERGGCKEKFVVEIKCFSP